MPKTNYITSSITKVSSIIHNVIPKTSGKPVAAPLLVALVISTSWTHVSLAESIDPASPETKEILVDGLTAAERAAKIDAYFAQYNLPAAGLGKVFVAAADREGLDWKFVAAKAMIESTGGKFVPKKDPDNMFGWGCTDRAGTKCRDFASKEEAINEVTAHLAGNRESTAKYYKDKTLSQKMSSYNKVNPRYQPLVFGVMNKIAAMKVVDTTAPVALAMK